MVSIYLFSSGTPTNLVSPPIKPGSYIIKRAVWITVDYSLACRISDQILLTPFSDVHLPEVEAALTTLLPCHTRNGYQDGHHT